MRRQVRGFFYAACFMVGGVLGSREAGRNLVPVFHPDTSSIAQSVEALVGGLKTSDKEHAMSKHTQVAPSAIEISHVVIRQDEEGRYCLADLHKAAGGELKHQPTNWLRTQPAKELIAEVEKSTPHIRGVKVINGGNLRGTYVVKELVYAYAMWISPKFNLQVIRAYDALQSQPQRSEIADQLPHSKESLSDEDWACLFVAHEETQHLITDLKPVLDMLSSVTLRNVDLYLKNLQIVTDKLRDRFGKQMDEAARRTGMFARKNWQPTLVAEKIKAQALENYRIRILTTIDYGQEPTQQTIPWDSCIVNPNDPVAVTTFIREFVPSNPKMLTAVSSAYIAKFLDCQDSALERIKSSGGKR